MGRYRFIVLVALISCFCVFISGCATRSSLSDKLETSTEASLQIQDEILRAKTIELDATESFDWSSWEDTTDEGASSRVWAQLSPWVEFIVIVQQVSPDVGELTVFIHDKAGQLIAIEPRRTSFRCGTIIVHESVYEPPQTALNYEVDHKRVDAVRVGVYSQILP